jgi:hypothetical protein
MNLKTHTQRIGNINTLLDLISTLQKMASIAPVDAGTINLTETHAAYLISKKLTDGSVVYDLRIEQEA